MKSEVVYDFIIIGSGMGGLSTACILAKEGFSILVLEKNHQLGGNLQVFSREKRIFDTGVHYVGSLDEGGNLYHYFKYLEILDNLKLKRLNQECFDLIIFPDGSKIPYAQGYEQFINTLIQFFPEEENAILTFCKKIKEICLFFPFYNLEIESSQNYFSNQEILEINAAEYIQSLTSNIRLQNVLAGNNLLYAGVKDKTPLYVLALILNSNLTGSYRFVDGSSQVAKELAKVIRKYGGKILKHQEVISANYSEKGFLTNVNCSSGKTFSAKNFISNLHPTLTIDIFGENRFLSAYVKRIKNLANTQSCFLVQLTLKEKSVKYFNYNLYPYFVDDVWESVNYSGKDWPLSLYISASVSSKNKEYIDVLTIMAYMSFEEVEKWSKSKNLAFDKKDRGQEYQEFKEIKEQQVLKKVIQILPEIKDNILNIYSATPLTFRDYVGTSNGSCYGILKNSNFPTSTMINSKTKIPNLFLTGQNLIFHGILGTCVGAFVTAFHFVDSKLLIQKIKNSTVDEKTEL
ncbi:MAG: NAD(P)/FAD-dependent oxidoreductase [Flavobacteriia bacterium]|nr:NAD(P)/FAD-dependent oxidoreductase [Flavobacteriia bacterium]